MNAQSIQHRIFELKTQLDLVAPEDCAYIQKQINEQFEFLQCITKVPMASLRRVVNKSYVLWLDGKYP